MKTIEQGIREIMAIIGEDKDYGKIEGGHGVGGAHVHSEKNTIDAKSATKTSINPITQQPKASPLETTYDGQGHTLSTNGKNAHTGYVKGRKKSNAKDTLRANLLDAAQVVLDRSSAFAGKTGRNSVEGVVVRLADADYSVKCAGHVKREFENRDKDFVPTKSYLTRGTTENHSAAIAKVLVAEFENQFSPASFGGFEIENSIQLLDVKAGAVRFEIGNSEFTFKITKKRARVVLQ